MPSFHLQNPDSGASCDIELGRGLDYAIAARTSAEIESLLEQLLQLPGAQVADSVGGLVANINTLENIALPAIYHRFAPVEELERRIADTFAACGLDEKQAEALCAKLPGELAPFDKRLVGFVRCLVMSPEVLVYSRFLEGLTRAEMERAAALNAVFRARCPQGTAVYLMLSDMPDLQLSCNRRLEL